MKKKELVVFIVAGGGEGCLSGIVGIMKQTEVVKIERRGKNEEERLRKFIIIASGAFCNLIFCSWVSLAAMREEVAGSRASRLIIMAVTPLQYSCFLKQFTLKRVYTA